MLSSIITITKDIKYYISSTGSTNYRGISLFNATRKIYEYAILSISNKCFQTSDMQFVYKQQHSTLMCSPLYHEVSNQLSV